MSIRNRLLSTTFIPIVMSVGVGLTVAGGTPQAEAESSYQVAAAQNPCNPCAAKNPCNPCAVKNPCSACAAANPCAAKSPCNPCAAKNPCNPCAAKNPCSPCAAKNPCNPCAAKSPCGPCAAKSPCSPCAAASPCSPCAAAAASKCIVPRLAAAQPSPCSPCAAKSPCSPCAAKNPCNPCAAANPCNPCAAKNPCSPCAAKNPCNPCAAANPCNPCAANPCAPSAAVELTDSEAKDAYSCIKGSLRAGYAKSNLASGTGLKIARDYQDWTRYSTRPYVSATHGGRFVQNYANTTAKAYGKYEDVGKLPAGSVLAKDSFAVRAGRVSAGPLFVMEKMPAGFNADSINWRYTLVMPDGKVIGTTNGKGSKNVEFCYACHAAIAGEQADSLFFLPEEYRVKF